MSSESFNEWAIIEVMGHRTVVGRVSEAELAGGSFIRVDVPAVGEGTPYTQYYRPEAIYCITPTTEDVARAIAEDRRPLPLARWEIPSRLLWPAGAGCGDED